MKEPKRSVKVIEGMDAGGNLTYYVKSMVNFVGYQIGTKVSKAEIQKLIDRGITVTISK